MKSTLPCLLALCALSGPLGADDPMLFRDGKSEYRIILPTNPGDAEKCAADEFRAAVKKMSGAELAIENTDTPPESGAVVIGSVKTSAAVRAKAGDLKLDGPAREKLAVYTLGKNLYLAGSTPQAALFATYSFLRDNLGCRWFWHGPTGEFIPAKTHYALPSLAWNFIPPIPHRALDPCGAQGFPPVHEWLPRVFITFERPKRYPRLGPDTLAGHGMRLKAADFAKYPKAFAEVGGKRTEKGFVGCWSSPQFLEAMLEKHKERIRNADIIELFPADMTLRCECGECKKIGPSTVRWFVFYKKFIEEAKKLNPDFMTVSLAYQEYRFAPEGVDLSYIDYADYCAYNACSIHAWDDPGCGINRNLCKELSDWSAKGVKWGIYGYTYDSLSANYTIPHWNVMAKTVKYLAKKNAMKIKEEQPIHTDAENPYKSTNLLHRLEFYLYCMMIWNPESDVNGHLADFCRYVYGPGADAMFAYHKTMAEKWEQIPGHCTYFKAREQGLAKFLFNTPFLRRLRKFFDAAEHAVSKEPDEAKRVRYIQNMEQDRVNLAQWESVLVKNPRSMPKAEIPKLSGDKAFENAAVLPVTSEGKRPGVPCEIRAYYTDDAIHMRFRVYDPEIAKRDPGTRESVNAAPHCIELFLDPADDRAYFQFIVNNTAGSMYKANAFTRIPDFKMDIQSAATPEAWTVDLVFPFASFGGKSPAPGSRWRIVAMVHDAGFSSAGFPLCAFHDMNSGAELVFGK